MSEPQKVGWESDVDIEKVRYVPLQRTNDKMDASEKEGVKVWNEMVTWIRNRNGMEDKD